MSLSTQALCQHHISRVKDTCQKIQKDSAYLPKALLLRSIHSRLESFCNEAGRLVATQLEQVSSFKAVNLPMRSGIAPTKCQPDNRKRVSAVRDSTAVGKPKYSEAVLKFVRSPGETVRGSELRRVSAVSASRSQGCTCAAVSMHRC